MLFHWSCNILTHQFWSSFCQKEAEKINHCILKHGCKNLVRGVLRRSSIVFPLWLINSHLKWKTLLNRNWTTASESSIHYCKWKTVPQEVSFHKDFLYTFFFFSYWFSLTLSETWHSWPSIPSQVLKHFYVWAFNSSTSATSPVQFTEWYGLEGTSGDHLVQPPCQSSSRLFVKLR